MKIIAHWRKWILPLALVVGIMGAIAYVCIQLGTWYIDDAAISLAYARNLAMGRGLVAQVGDVPVEGFSNPLWVGLEALAVLISGSCHLWFSRAIAVVIILGLMAHIVCRYRQRRDDMTAWLLVLFFSVLQPSVSIWSLSGLENSLMVLFGMELMMELSEIRQGVSVKAGVFMACLCLTRPDGAVFIGSGILALLLGRCNEWNEWRRVARVMIIPIGVLLTLLAARFFYFGALFPNTFLAKGQPTSVSVSEVLLLGPEMRERLSAALMGTFGTATPWILVLICIVLALDCKRLGCAVRKHLPICAVFCLAAFAYAYLPNDWMPLFRFATLFYVSFYALLVMGMRAIENGSRKIFILSVSLVAMMSCLVTTVRKFVLEAPIRVEHVRERGDYFRRWGNLVGLEKPLLLTADAGGILLAENVRLLDLGMLCDRKIAQFLGERNGTPRRRAFHDYIFEMRKPDFIAIRAYHSWLAGLDKDPRFRNMYVPIHEYLDLWGIQRGLPPFMSGDYVRIDLVHDSRMLAIMQDESKSIYYPFDIKGVHWDRTSGRAE